MFNLNFKISNFLVCSVLIGAFTGSAFAAEDDLEAYKKGYREAYLDIMRAKEAELSKKQITAKEETKAQDTQTQQAKTNQSQSRTESVTTTGNDGNTPVVVNITLDNSAKQTVSNDSVSTNNNTNNNKNAGLGLAPKAEETDYSYLYGGIGIGSVSGYKSYEYTYNQEYSHTRVNMTGWPIPYYVYDIYNDPTYDASGEQETTLNGVVIDMGYRFGKYFAINFSRFGASSETDDVNVSSTDDFDLKALSGVLILPLNKSFELGIEAGYATSDVKYSINQKGLYKNGRAEYRSTNDSSRVNQYYEYERTGEYSGEIEYTGYMAGLHATYHLNDNMSMVAKYRRYELSSDTQTGDSLSQAYYSVPDPTYSSKFDSQTLDSISFSLVYALR